MDVPLEHWQVGPWNRWAYQHVGEVVPTVPVRCGAAAELPSGEAPLGDLADPPFADGVAVLHDGELVLERYANGMGEATLHLSQSVGKSVLGLLTGALGIEPETPVASLVPEVAGGGYAGATLRHLLDMTAATDFVEAYAAGFWRYDVACGWHPPHPDAPAGTILEYLPTIGPAAERHGERFQYATPNTDLLGIAVERAAGAPLAELIATRLWAPLGAASDAELTVDPAGTGAIGGGFCATLRDYTRLGALVLEGGRGIVPGAWIAELGTGGYRNQWWERGGRPTAVGIHGQLIAVDRPSRTVVTILSSWPDAEDAAHEAAQRAFVSAVCERLG